MKWLWPRHSHTETTALIRFGRVLHWASIAIAILVALIGLGDFGFSLEGFVYVAWAFVTAVIGCGFRYILAGE